MSSSREILKRACLRRSNEGLPAGDPGLHEHAVLQGEDASGANLTARSAIYPPALRAAILRGVAAQRTREGRRLGAPVGRRLGRGRAVCDLSENSPPNELELQQLAAEAAEG
eukprot:9268453-Alexandrium_andersonii.AAC.1